jgi:hypothetical protein
MAHGGKVPGPSGVLRSILKTRWCRFSHLLVVDSWQTFSPELFTDDRLNAVHVSIDLIQMFSIGDCSLGDGLCR